MWGRDIATTLSHDERTEVAQFMRPFDAFPVLKEPKDYLPLFERYRQSEGEAARRMARDRLVYGNMRLVLKMAYRYRGLGLSLTELLIEGVSV